MPLDFCRETGSTALLSGAKLGSIPGAVNGAIPSKYCAKTPIYFDSVVTLDEFLAGNTRMFGRETPTTGEIFSAEPPSENAPAWPVASRFSFVSAALLTYLFLFLVQAAAIGSPALAAENESISDKNTLSSSDKHVQIAHRMPSSSNENGIDSGRIISFVCGRPNTLQAFAAIDLPCSEERLLPQGASPIAEMKSMPKVSQRQEQVARAQSASSAKLDRVSTERMYQRLLKLSLSNPSAFQAEAPSLITYFSILTGGQEQNRVNELETLLQNSFNNK